MKAMFTAPKNEELHDRVSQAVAEAANRKSRETAALVEDRILAGENDFTMGDVRYIVPGWRHRPVARAKIAWARLTR